MYFSINGEVTHDVIFVDAYTLYVFVVEKRLIDFGTKTKDNLANMTSRATGEMVTKLIKFPIGIPLQDGAGNIYTCRSFYVSRVFKDFMKNMKKLFLLRHSLLSIIYYLSTY